MANDKIQIPIDALVMHKIYTYAAYAKHHFNSEVAGWAHYTEENGIYKVAPLSKQIVSGAEVDVFPDDILRDTKYDTSDMVVQWHSHVDMGVFFSGTDTANVKSCMEIFPMLISIIVNCKGQYIAKLSICKAGGAEKIKLPQLDYDVELMPYYDDKDINKEVLKKCSKPKPKVYIQPKVDTQSFYQTGFAQPYGTPYGGNRGWNDDDWWGSQYEDDVIPPKKPIELVPAKEMVKGMITETIKTEKKILNYAVTYKESGFTQEELNTIKKMMDTISKDLPQEFSEINSDGMSILQHMKTQTYVVIDKDGMEINGVVGTWKSFLDKVGLKFDYAIKI